MVRLIKRYGNRKLYDTRASRYVTLDNIAELVRAGDDLRIIDNDTGEDLTAVTFAQIIFEESKQKNGMPGVPLLRRIIQQGEEAVQDFISSMDRGREALDSVRTRAEKRVRDLVQSGEPGKRSGRKATGRNLLEDLVEAPQRQLEQFQRRIDAQVRNSLERLRASPMVKSELRRLEKSIRSVERRLSGVLGGSPPARKRTSSKKRPTRRGRPASSR
jgi:polyhydroxyalkanoate synthesis repressor PhaR